MPFVGQADGHEAERLFSRLRSDVPRLARMHPEEVIGWVSERIGTNRMTFACSFGLEDVALVDMVMRVCPEMDIFYLDTGLFFPETHQVREQLSERYGKTWIRVASVYTLAEQEEKFGKELWARDPDLCCHLRKVEPLRRFLRGYEAWMTGIRRGQSKTRANAEVVEWDERFQCVKVNPLAYWSMEQVWDYVRKHEVPYNPLHERNYPSIGCRPCTKAVGSGEDLRAGRWRGLDKTECGLHGRGAP
jgi:phosphoadenosine phosphosulfate reductase